MSWGAVGAPVIVNGGTYQYTVNATFSASSIGNMVVVVGLSSSFNNLFQCTALLFGPNGFTIPLNPFPNGDGTSNVAIGTWTATNTSPQSYSLDMGGNGTLCSIFIQEFQWFGTPSSAVIAIATSPSSTTTAPLVPSVADSLYITGVADGTLAAALTGYTVVTLSSNFGVAYYLSASPPTTYSQTLSSAGAFVTSGSAVFPYIPLVPGAVGKFVTVAGGYVPSSFYSSDGISWTSSSLVPGFWTKATFGNGKFVTVSRGAGAAAYSSDGITWATTTMPSSVAWWPVAFGNGVFVSAGYLDASGLNPTNAAAYSTDGITWTATTMPSAQNWFSITYGGKFVAVSQSSTAAYSTDGITWTAATLPSSSDWSSVAYGNGKFVAVSQASSAAAYSTDGITWTAATLPSNGNWNTVTYGGGKFVAFMSGSSNAAYSTDGITWTAATLSTGNNWEQATYGDGRFVVVGYVSTTSTINYSTDGITWSAASISDSQTGIAYGVVIPNSNPLVMII